MSAIPIAAGATWMHVTCRLGDLVPDGVDVDGDPDLLPMVGTVALSVGTAGGLLRIMQADGHTRLVAIRGDMWTIRADGELVDSESRVGLWLPLPSSPAVDPQGWTAGAVIEWDGNRRGVTFDPATPTHADGTLNLADVVAVLPAAGVAAAVASSAQAAASASAAAASASAASGSAAAAQQAETNAEAAQAAAEAVLPDMIVGGTVVGDDLILTRQDATTLNAGDVRGATGPASSLTIGTVTTGAAGSSAAASITGTAPSQALNLTIPSGPQGAPGAPDATTTTKGIVQLAGDLAGTAAAPTVPGLAGKAASVHTHAVTDLTATGTRDATTYLRGDNTWATPAGGGGGVTDHGALTGLSDDDHSIYHTDARGDARYSALGHNHTGTYAPVLGADDNYVTDAEKAALHAHPAVIAQGATAADARTAIGAAATTADLGGAFTSGAATVGQAPLADGAGGVAWGNVAASGGVTTALYVAGVGSFNGPSAPDTAGLSITGDLDVRVKITPSDWTPASNFSLLSKWGAAGARSWRLRIQSAQPGRVVLSWSADGTAALGSSSTAAVPFTDGTAGWVRATLDVDNGAGGSTLTFYTSTDGVTWTPLGSPIVSAGVTSIFDSAAAAVQLSYDGDLYYPPIDCLYHEAEIRNGIDGTLVGRWDGRAPHTRQRDAAGNIWTINGTSNAWQVV